MPRKLRTPKQQVTALPSPAWTFALLVGADPGCRLQGWPQQLQAGLCGAPAADDVWTLHADALVAEAALHEFEPYWLHSRAPTGPGFRAWRDAFLAEHRY